MIGELDICAVCGRRPSRLGSVGSRWWRLRCDCGTRVEWIVGESSEIGEPQSAKERETIEFINSMLAHSQPAARTLVETYLRSRCINTVPVALRFVPRLRHRPSGVFQPAMIVPIVDVKNVVIGVHRTWLAPDGSGKAAVEPNRMMLGHCAGGAARLAKAAYEIGVAEGIETALSAGQMWEVPTWAALSTTGLKALNLPGSVMRITIFADGDRSGIEAARDAASRWRGEGRAVRVLRPKEAGKDFNDLMREKAEKVKA